MLRRGAGDRHDLIAVAVKNEIVNLQRLARSAACEWILQLEANIA
jgi:hypothetical protein